MALNAHFNSALNNLALDMYANAYHAKIESGAEPPKSREEFLQLFKTMFDVKVKSENVDDGDVVIIDPPSKVVETVSVEPPEVKVVAKAPRAPRKKSEKSASTSSDDETSSVESSESGDSVVSKQRIKAEKDAEKLRIKAEKDAEKLRIKAEKDAEKAKAKALKDAEKAKAKALKEVQQAKAKADKEAEKEAKAKAKAEKEAEKAKAKLEKEAKKEEQAKAKALKQAEKEAKPLVETKSATTATTIVEETHEELSDGEVDEDESYAHKFTLDQKNYGVDCDNDVFEIKSDGDSNFVGTWDKETETINFN